MEQRSIPIAVALAAMVATAFGGTYAFDFLNLDDDLYVTANPYVQRGLTWETTRWAFTAFHSGHWHPLTWLSLATDVELFGVRPGPMHVVNVALHALATVLLFWVLRAATGATWRSAVVAALFGLHPLRLESVAWITERKDVLSVLCWIGAMGLYVRYARGPTTARYLALTAVFVLGILAKPMLVTLPIALLLMDYWPLGRWQPGAGAVSAGGHLLTEKLPLLALGAVAGTVTAAAQRAAGATVALDVLPAVARLANACWGYLRYLGKTLWPADLAIFYPLETVPPARGAFALVVLGALTAAALRLGRRHPYLIVGWLWWLVTLLPVIGLVQIGGQAIADRFTYVPHIGLFVLGVWGLHDLLGDSRRGRAAAATAAAIAIGACLAQTLRQLPHWQNSTTVFRHALAVTSGNYMAHNNLGLVLADAGKRDEAAEHYAEAVRINPTWPEARNNLGTAYAARGEYARARAEFEAALRVRPTFAIAENNLGTAYAFEGDFPRAVEHYTRAVTLAPDNFDARLGLADALERLGRLDDAYRHYVRLRQARPGSQLVASRLDRIERARDAPAR